MGIKPNRDDIMALVKCKECGAMISSSASACPHCGKKKPNTTCLVILLIPIAIFMIVFTLVSTNMEKTINKKTAINATPEIKYNEIPYSVVRSSTIPNGGFYRTIVIDPKYSNEKDMRDLGETLKEDCSGDRNAAIQIFDDINSAKILTQQKMNHYADNMNDHSGDKYYKHLIGIYEKNLNTGHHVLFITLDGALSDRKIDVVY